ncbi:MAG TPA: pitrilysin family protein [Rhodanobacteraceae bacterium]
MKRSKMTYLAVAVAMVLGSVSVTSLAKTAPAEVTRATLANGLRVVIVRDTLAPVVTTEMNYLVGADEAPKGFPGMAHAMEHMMFRGSPGLSKNQLLAIASDMGGNFDADTQHGVTQYYFTVPAQDLDVALHIAATRMRGVDVTEKGWQKERGAIEQEVSRDHSNPAFKFQLQLAQHMFAGTPYAWQGLGTRPSFNKTTAAQLHKFYTTWYAPNNAILVIAGDVDPSVALSKVKALFGSIPRKTLPAKPAFHFSTMSAHTITLSTDFPVGIVVKAWRLPGLRDKDYATALVLSGAMGSKRGQLFAMGMTGKALFGGFGGRFMPHAGIAFAQAGFPRGGDAKATLTNVNAIMAATAAKGVPAALVEAAKQKVIAGLEYKKNSVSGLANAWSAALANGGFHSPDDLRAAIARVTPAQVNALAKRIFNPAHAMTAILTPQSSGKPISHSKFGGAESFAGKPSGQVTLPSWAQAAFAKLSIPDLNTHPTAFTLANGLHVIVQPESVSKTVEVFGEVKTNSDMQAPKGQKGVGRVLESMFNFGTEKLNRLQFQAALDAISANESAGTSFSLAVPARHFAQGMQLLAANELHPAMPMPYFMVMRRNAAGQQAGTLKSPAFINSMHMNRALYPASFPGNRYATPKSINALTLADIKAYQKQVFRPDMTTIVVIGDVTPAAARKVVEASFGSWKASGAKPDTDYPAVPPNKPTQFNTPDKSAVQDSVSMTETIALNSDNPDRYALTLGNDVLGGGFHSHLMRDLRVKGGLVYGVSSGTDLEKYNSTFSVNFGCDPDKVSEARAMVVRDIKQMQTAPVTAAELHYAKGKILRQLQLSQSSFGGIGGALLSLSVQGKPLDSLQVAAHKYYAMSADKIQSVFKQYLRPNAFVTAVKGPAPKG